MLIGLLKFKSFFFTLDDKLPSGNILIELEDEQSLKDLEIILQNTNNFLKDN